MPTNNMSPQDLSIYMFTVAEVMTLWMEPVEAFLGVAETHARYGTTAMMTYNTDQHKRRANDDLCRLSKSQKS
ncbi:hypothetical protein NXY15_08720 [Bacteroides thetaiotaomicron]|nr:hypothetical protein NXY15_08720 [Bacteroides thetaiotaomicron]